MKFPNYNNKFNKHTRSVGTNTSDASETTQLGKKLNMQNGAEFFKPHPLDPPQGILWGSISNTS